jgi:uncharacterized membrane protein YcgQ (UPF0703/DUF1980 family)
MNTYVLVGKHHAHRDYRKLLSSITATLSNVHKVLLYTVLMIGIISGVLLIADNIDSIALSAAEFVFNAIDLSQASSGAATSIGY